MIANYSDTSTNSLRHLQVWSLRGLRSRRVSALYSVFLKSTEFRDRNQLGQKQKHWQEVLHEMDHS